MGNGGHVACELRSDKLLYTCQGGRAGCSPSHTLLNPHNTSARRHPLSQLQIKKPRLKVSKQLAQSHKEQG